MIIFRPAMTGQDGSFLLQVYFYCTLFKDNVDAASLTTAQKSSVNRLIKKRWDSLHNDLHGAAFCMKPELWDVRLNNEVSILHSLKLP